MVIVNFVLFAGREIISCGLCFRFGEGVRGGLEAPVGVLLAVLGERGDRFLFPDGAFGAREGFPALACVRARKKSDGDDGGEGRRGNA